MEYKFCLDFPDTKNIPDLKLKIVPIVPVKLKFYTDTFLITDRQGTPYTLEFFYIKIRLTRKINLILQDQDYLVTLNLSKLKVSWL